MELIFPPSPPWIALSFIGGHPGGSGGWWRRGDEMDGAGRLMEVFFFAE